MHPEPELRVPADVHLENVRTALGVGSDRVRIVVATNTRDGLTMSQFVVEAIREKLEKEKPTC